ncbi:MAG: UTP--glucose-1-phosphate uridylyltransferase [Candidatus Gracilibacteria bacterium]|jgi:UTP--glucose-1-phosphate uridylyltransferase
MTIKKAVIPVAGLGTRFFPATKSIAKEMLPIVDKPCIQYLVEEAVASGIKEIIFVISKDKPSIKDHFSCPKKLKKLLLERGKTNELKSLEKIDHLAKFSYVYQPKPLGDGDAIMCAKKLIKNEPFAVLFGDDIWDGKTPALLQLIQQYNKYHSPIVALEKISKNETQKYGIVGIKSRKNRLTEINGFIEKPLPKNAPSDLAITGKYIVTPELFKYLEKTTSATKDKELRLIDGMRAYVKKHPIYGYEVEGLRFDTGDKLGYLKAVVHFATKDKTLGPTFKKHLLSLDL